MNRYGRNETSPLVIILLLVAIAALILAILPMVYDAPWEGVTEEQLASELRYQEVLGHLDEEEQTERACASVKAAIEDSRHHPERHLRWGEIPEADVLGRAIESILASCVPSK